MADMHPQQIEMIPISRITVLNPRARNKRQHREIVNNIEAIGLKRPITVSLRPGDGSPRYDLVCGEGRLEAFQMLGQSEIPAVVIEAIYAVTGIPSQAKITLPILDRLKANHKNEDVRKIAADAVDWLSGKKKKD